MLFAWTSESLRMAGLPLALLLAHGGCAARDATPACTVEGSSLLPGAPDEAQVCEDFMRMVEAARAQSRSADDSDAYTVALVIDPRGSLRAQLVAPQPDGTTKNYPEIAIDVMDRPLARDDLGRLAKAVAAFLAKH